MAKLWRVPVLVVDDDAPSAKLFALVLRGVGCDVQVADSAEDALTRLETFHPRVIVLDLALPGMSGILLADVLRRDPAHADTILIAVTAVNGTAIEAMALSAGCAAYVRKPIDIHTFPDLVERLALGGP